MHTRIEQNHGLHEHGIWKQWPSWHSLKRHLSVKLLKKKFLLVKKPQKSAVDWGHEKYMRNPTPKNWRENCNKHNKLINFIASTQFERFTKQCEKPYRDLYLIRSQAKTQKKEFPNDIFNTFDIWISLSVSRHWFSTFLFFCVSIYTILFQLNMSPLTAVVAIDTEMLNMKYIPTVPVKVNIKRWTHTMYVVHVSIDSIWRHLT